jgi:hypothetical protein
VNRVGCDGVGCDRVGSDRVGSDRVGSGHGWLSNSSLNLWFLSFYAVNVTTGRRSIPKLENREVDTESSMKTDRTTFHIPQDTVKNLHITSETTVKEVVEALLKKYSVTDHPKKFALFEKTLHINEG